jgi:hypothetical protein
MIKHLAIVMLLAASAASAQQVGVIRNELGSGTPGTEGYERAIPVAPGDDILHAPQYMPFYPTAGVIWPRVVEVPCVRSGDVLKCEGYQWQPKLGRGEYLFIKPIITEAPAPVAPQLIIREVPIVILKEVPVKKKRE